MSVGVCDVLNPDDVVFGTYRGHALYLAKGGDLCAMVAELYGKATGCTRGKGGSMHLIDTECGVMGTSAVVGTTIANAAGTPTPSNSASSDAVVVSFFGDGATEEGVFAETSELRGPEESAHPLRLREQRLRHPHAPVPPAGTCRYLCASARLRNAGGAR